MTCPAPPPLRVLVVAAHEAWPLDSGGRLHLYHVLTQLARRAEVTLALPFAPRHADQLPPEIRVTTIPQEPLASHARPPRAHHRRFIGRRAARHFGLHAALAHWLDRHTRPTSHDVVMLNGAVYGQYAPYCHIPVVWNPQDELFLTTWRDAEHAPWLQRPVLLARAALYAAYERYVMHQAAATIFVSSVDTGYARRWAPGARIETVQNGVDFDYFHPAPEAPEPGIVAFVGALDFGPNIDASVFFATRVWPRIHAADRDRRLLLVGRRPVPAVRALAALPGVELAADVPDVRPYLTRAAVVVVPTRTGGGLKNKILEACALRRPVVASPRALGGLSARIGHDLLAAEDPARWATLVDHLLTHPANTQALAINGYDWVRRAHSWTTTGTRFHEILTTAAHQRRGQSVTLPRHIMAQIAASERKNTLPKAHDRHAPHKRSHPVTNAVREAVCP